MEVLSELEAGSALRFLGFGLSPEKVVEKILEHRKFYSPAAVKRDVERLRIGEVTRQKKLAEGRK